MLQKRTSSRSSSQRLRNIVAENRQNTPGQQIKNTSSNAAALLGITKEYGMTSGSDSGAATNFINKKAPKPKTYGQQNSIIHSNNLSFLPEKLSPVKANHDAEMFPEINSNEQTIQNLKSQIKTLTKDLEETDFKNKALQRNFESLSNLCAKSETEK